ncbi:MAG: DUF3095 family protein [Ferruginibacter sp.]
MDEHFYESLPVHQGSIGAILNREHLFCDVPEGWEIVLTDIRGSSAAVDEGMHKAVNLIATGSIVCVLNIAHKHQVIIPFFFGGDGATFLILLCTRSYGWPHTLCGRLRWRTHASIPYAKSKNQ